MSARFECVSLIPAAPRAAFALSLDIGLHLGSMAASGERAVGARITGVLGPGEEVTWRARHFGMAWTMTSRITAYEPAARFVDEQVRGPFRFFRHEHLFAGAPGGTRMTDLIEFAAPVPLIGLAAERLVLERYLRALIEQRNAYLAGQAAASLP